MNKKDEYLSTHPTQSEIKSIQKTLLTLFVDINGGGAAMCCDFLMWYYYYYY
jgi:hypothetical protein